MTNGVAMSEHSELSDWSFRKLVLFSSERSAEIPNSSQMATLTWLVFRISASMNFWIPQAKWEAMRRVGSEMLKSPRPAIPAMSNGVVAPAMSGHSASWSIWQTQVMEPKLEVRTLAVLGVVFDDHFIPAHIVLVNNICIFLSLV